MNFIIPCFIVLTSATNHFNYGKKVMVNAARITEYNSRYVTLSNGKTTSRLQVQESKNQIKHLIRKECSK